MIKDNEKQRMTECEMPCAWQRCLLMRKINPILVDLGKLIHAGRKLSKANWIYAIINE